MEENKTNLQTIINSLNAFYGEIHKFISLYDVEEKETNEIEELDKYINDLKAQKEKQKKEPATSKIEITGMPELKIKKSERLSESKKKQIKETVLYLNQDGDLYREPKDKYYYPMGQKSNRYRIIRFLTTNKGYQLTEFISMELKIESKKTIRTEIGKIRNNIEKYLKINGKDLLQGKKGSGYRINPKYKVILKNE